jgi:ketosteroid isomerase-like protein
VPGQTRFLHGGAPALREGVPLMRAPSVFSSASLALVLALVACKGQDGSKPATATATATPAAPSGSASAVTNAATSEASPGLSAARVAQQTAFIRSFADAYNKHDAAAIAALYAPDAIYAELSSEGGESKGTAAIQKDYATVFEGFTDVKMAITRSWHTKDVVAFETVQGGTGTGNDDKDRKFGLTGAHLVWFDDAGKVTRDQIYEDDLTVMNQLGWSEGNVAKIPVRPIREVPAFTGTWETNVATGTPEEAKGLVVRDKLYTKLMSPSSESEFLGTVADDIVMAEYDDPTDAVGKKAVADVFKDWHKTFSGMRIEATHAWPCGPYVIFEGVFAGKQSGPWGPMKPTNREFTSHFLDVTRVTKDGKVDRLWTYASSAEILGLHKK